MNFLFPFLGLPSGRRQARRSLARVLAEGYGRRHLELIAIMYNIFLMIFKNLSRLADPNN
jgi:hypothetical protein